MSENISHKDFDQYFNKETGAPIIIKHDISNMMLGHFVRMFFVNGATSYQICLLTNNQAYDVKNDIVTDMKDPSKQQKVDKVSGSVGR